MAEIHHLNKIPDFDEFWDACPKRVGKSKCRVLFNAITQPGGTTTQSLNRDSGQYMILQLEATPAQLIEAMKAYRKTQYVVVNEKYKLSDYCLHPLTFLNSGRFEDFLG